jgi:hypothetical protein
VSKKKSTPAAETPTHDSGLAAMLAASRQGEHGVLADWVEENLRLDDLAACLRAGGDDPRTKGQRDQTVFTGFRYRQLDRFVLLFLAEFEVFEWARGGKKKGVPKGHVLGLCLSDAAPEGPTRLVRWLTNAVAGDPLARLWTDLGQGRPAELQEE